MGAKIKNFEHRILRIQEISIRSNLCVRSLLKYDTKYQINSNPPKKPWPKMKLTSKTTRMPYVILYNLLKKEQDKDTQATET